jgi:hypothetical protein
MIKGDIDGKESLEDKDRNEIRGCGLSLLLLESTIHIIASSSS